MHSNLSHDREDDKGEGGDEVATAAAAGGIAAAAAFGGGGGGGGGGFYEMLGEEIQRAAAETMADRLVDFAGEAFAFLSSITANL